MKKSGRLSRENSFEGGGLLERTQFTFYESFYRSMCRIRKKADRADAYDSIVAYALYGTEPDMDRLPDSAAIVFELARANLDASRRKAESGKSGGEAKANAKQTSSKPLANAKQTPSKPEANGKQEKEQEKEQVKDKEQEQMLSPQPPTDADLARVLSYFLDKINALPSSSCVEDLKHYTAELGADVVIHAFGRAQDEKKTGWGYIRAILESYAQKQFRTVAAVLEDEHAHRAKKDGKTASPANYGVSPEDAARMQRALEKIKRLPEVDDG